MKLLTLLIAGSISSLLLNTPLVAQQISKTAVPETTPKVYEWQDVTPCSFDEKTAIELIQSRVKYPAVVLEKHLLGEVPVEFVVDATGKARDAKVLEAAYYYKPADPAVTAAVLTAVNNLPKLQPAVRDGKPVAVRMKLAIRYPNPPPSENYSAGPNRVYKYAEQMPELPGGGGGPAIMAAIQKNLK